MLRYRVSRYGYEESCRRGRSGRTRNGVNGWLFRGFGSLSFRKALWFGHYISLCPHTHKGGFWFVARAWHTKKHHKKYDVSFVFKIYLYICGAVSRPERELAVHFLWQVCTEDDFLYLLSVWCSVVNFSLKLLSHFCLYDSCDDLNHLCPARYSHRFFF